ncbi:helix-turn-helix domain-containing protein [Siphonobacter curvatus]|nr:helix-turn-helix transcriptional regulator [Siphonobacter curvatus]
MYDWFSGVYVHTMDALKLQHPLYEMSQPHRHDFYYCIVLDKGEMELEVDFEKVQLNDHHIFVSYPGQIHHIVSAQVKRGWFLAFDPAILDVNLRSILDQCLAEIILIPVASQQFAHLYSLIDHLYLIYKEPAPLFQEQVIQGMLSSLIYRFASIYLQQEKSRLRTHSTRSIEMTKIFRQMLRNNFRTMKSTSQYAAEMNISASHLNDTVKSVTGFPITYHIQQELMREARRLLYYSDHTILAVADELGFNDLKYFTRLFSKIIGVAPSTFKKMKSDLNKVRFKSV